MFCNCESKVCPYVKSCARTLNENVDDKYQTWTDFTYECMWNDTFDYFISVISEKNKTEGESDV